MAQLCSPVCTLTYEVAIKEPVGLSTEPLKSMHSPFDVFEAGKQELMAFGMTLDMY